MNKIAKHIAFKILTLVVIGALFAPTAVKLNHIFEHHEHINVCCSKSASTHIHKTDFDCDFQKFPLNHFFTLPTQTFTYLNVLASNKIPAKTYNFLVNHQHLSFSLRAPPTIIS